MLKPSKHFDFFEQLASLAFQSCHPALAYFANGQFLFFKITLRFCMSNSDR
jgi:hypothetical protein